MKNIFVIHSLNGDTLEFQGQDVKQKFEDKLNVFTPKFPIRADGKKEYVYTLNASGIATSRIFPAILEQYQNADGTVTVPDCLVPYFGLKVLK